MAYEEISAKEALEHLVFTTAISRWKALYQCSYEEAQKKVIECLNERLIKRLGAFAIDWEKTLNISMGFRPSSYQEMLAPNNNGKWNASKCKESNSLIDNLKCWYGGNWDVAAAPGTSNHNTGAAADVSDGWFQNITNDQLAPYGLTKNVTGEKWHVVVVDMANIKSYDRVQYAIDKGYEPQICPCQIQYVRDRYINVGASVALVQIQLKAQGYDCGMVDGCFGSKTKAAVEAYQRAHKLTPDGVVGARTIAKLFEEEPIQVFTVSRLLKLTDKFMTGDDVKWLQIKLNENNANLSIDGVFGQKTDAAVRTYQKVKELTVDGIAGEETITDLGGKFND